MSRNGRDCGRSHATARFVSAEVHYGCHARRVEFRDGADPFVVSGPNGTGKTTLIEGIVRTLYGHDRRQDRDKERIDSRRPWKGGAFRGQVVLATREGDRLRIERQFESDEVVAWSEREGRELFRGIANPAGSADARAPYCSILQRVFGFRDMEPYFNTACLRQGDLLHTRLTDALLGQAAGGHAAVNDARDTLHERFGALTVAPLEGTSPKRKPREREDLIRQLEEARERLRVAAAAARARGPILDEIEECEAGASELGREIRRLEAALAPLAERRAIEGHGGLVRARIRRLEAAAARLGRARDARAMADSAREQADRGGRYPEDFAARAGALGVLWQQREQLHRETERAAATRATPASRRTFAAGAGVALAVLIAAGVALIVGGRTDAGIILVVMGAAGGLAAWLYTRRRRQTDRARAASRIRECRGRLEENAAEIAGHLEGVPRADTLSSDTLPEHRAAFERQTGSAVQADRAARELADAVSEATAVLEDPGGLSEGVSAETPAGAPAEAGVAPLLQTLGERTSDLRTGLAAHRIRLESIALDRLDLPEGVAAATEGPDGVNAALETRRAELDALRERARGLERRLSNEGRPEASPVALVAEVEALEERLAAVEREIRIVRLAYDLLVDAYEEFRAGDQDRLVRHIDRYLAGLTGSVLGPLRVEGSLARTRVWAFGRTLPLDSPPLSFGEWHAALLAIRLGAADFLADGGVRPPLIVDEPFAHLDEARAADVWRVLREIARERQVLVATQDRLVLEHLGVAPDVVLTKPEHESAGPREKSTAPPRETPAAPPHKPAEPPQTGDWEAPTFL